MYSQVYCTSAVLDVWFGPDAAERLLAAQHSQGGCVMDAKRWFSLVLLTPLLVACAQPAATPTPTPPSMMLKDPGGIFVDSGRRIYVVDEGNNRIVRLDEHEPPVRREARSQTIPTRESDRRHGDLQDVAHACELVWDEHLDHATSSKTFKDSDVQLGTDV